MNRDHMILTGDNGGTTDKLDAAVTTINQEVDRARVTAVQAEHTARSAQQEAQDARHTADDAWDRSRTAVGWASVAAGMTVVNVATLIIVTLNR